MSFLSNALERVREHIRPGKPAKGAFDELSFERSLTDNALRRLAPSAAPRDLALRIRLAISHERVRAQHNWVSRMHDRAELFWDNTVRPMAVQVVVATVALVAVTGGALMLSGLAPQQAVEANDEPLAGFSAPRYMWSAVDTAPLASTNEAPLIVKAMIDAKGRIYDYKVLSGATDERTSQALQQRMLTSVFKPARVFDQPVRGSILLTFGDIVVRG